jgi:hypothetical protein
MVSKRKVSVIVLCAAVIAGGCAIAQGSGPSVDIGSRHGALRHAQELISQAYTAIDSAQDSNHDRLGGHAAKAKDLLMQASQELRYAADTANSHEH